MNHRMTVRANGNEVRRRINFMNFTDRTKRLQVMNVDKTVGNITVGRQEIESADNTRRSAFCDAHCPQQRVSFISRQLDDQGTPLNPDLRAGCTEQLQLLSGCSLALKAHCRGICSETYKAKECQLAVPVVNAAPFVNRMLGRLTVFAGKRIHFGLRVHSRRRVIDDAVRAVNAVLAVADAGVRFKFQRSCNELLIGRDANGERLSAPPSTSLDKYCLIWHVNNHTPYTPVDAIRRAA